MESYNYMCDMGSMKIMLRDGAIFFSNNFGDGIFDVNVCNQDEVPAGANFKGHFTIFTEGWLMYSDCDVEHKQHKFEKGRYFVSLAKDGVTFFIYKMDEDIHA